MYNEHTYCKLTRSVKTEPHYTFTAKARISRLFKQDPGFHITGDLVYNRRHTRCCGSLHDEVNKYFKSWGKYLKWHGFHVRRGEWYYHENAVFRAGLCETYSLGKRMNEINLDHLKSLIRYGVVPGDEEFDLTQVLDNFPMQMTKETLALFNDPSPLLAEEILIPLEQVIVRDAKRRKLIDFLEERKPALMDAFHADMWELFGDQFDLNAITADMEKIEKEN